MKYNSTCVFLIAWMLSACSQPRVDGTVFHESKKVFAEKIPVNEMFSPDFVTKSGDYFIISSSRSDTTLFLYETPSLTFKNATGIKGMVRMRSKCFLCFAIHWIMIIYI